MLFTERNTFSCTRVLCIKRSVKYDIPPFATIRKLAKLLAACPSATREMGPTNRLLRSIQGNTAKSCSVRYVQRRPSRRPFHELPNVLITPHSSSSSDATADRRWSVVAANLDRFVRGEPLENVVLQS